MTRDISGPRDYITRTSKTCAANPATTLNREEPLFDRSPFDFERWAVSLVNGTPNQKQVGDKGIDGVVRFLTDGRGGTGRVLVSVKGGRTVGPTAARDLGGTLPAITGISLVSITESP